MLLPKIHLVLLLTNLYKFTCFKIYVQLFTIFRLCENPIQLYDPKINALFLQECIKRLLVMYDATRESKRKLGKGKPGPFSGLVRYFW